MAARQRIYVWSYNDNIWKVCALFLQPAGFSDTASMATAVRQANPTILNWKAVPIGTQITIPYAA